MLPTVLLEDAADNNMIIPIPGRLPIFAKANCLYLCMCELTSKMPGITHDPSLMNVASHVKMQITI